MVDEADILRRIPELLGDLSGLTPEPLSKGKSKAADVVVRLGGRLLVVEARSNSRAGVMAEAAQRVVSLAHQFGPEAVPLIAVPFMGDVGRRICEQSGVGFVDLSGNANIKAPPLVIRVEGRPNRFVRRGRPSSVFAPKSSRVVRLLLLEPKRWWRQHELAQQGSLGAGYVSRICKRLEAERLIERDGHNAVRPRNPALLLDAWRASYDFDSHDVERGHVPARSGEELTERVSSLLKVHGVRHALTGLAAAWRLAPFAAYRLVTVYVDDGRDRQILDALKWKAGERGANLWLVRPNDGGVFHGAQVVKGANCVSPIQAYLDLQGLPERSDEAAAHLKEELLRWQ